MSVKLSDLLVEDGINVSLEAKDKTGVITELVGLLTGTTSEEVGCNEDLVAATVSREELMSTGIGQGVAIPHAKSDKVDRLHAVFGRSAAGIDFDSLDQKPVHLFFLLIAPTDQSGPHVKALARISRLLKHAYFRQALLDATKASDVLTIIREEELKNS
ncbi:MAG: PTS sugar transporter subunit IIA [Candidatus Lindowbacteria bacterium]|nr:PTS sugar transporter subunit IIA [Candidatus Lindowbacteria bacterium]